MLGGTFHCVAMTMHRRSSSTAQLRIDPINNRLVRHPPDPEANSLVRAAHVPGSLPLVLTAGRSEARFSVHADRLSFTGPAMKRIVESGEMIFRIGTAGAAYAGPVSVRLVGPTRTVVGERVMETPFTIR